MAGSHEKWLNVPSPVTSALAMLTESVTRQAQRIVTLEEAQAKSLGVPEGWAREKQALENELTAAGDLARTQGAQLQALAEQVERLTATVNQSDRQRQVELREVLAVETSVRHRERGCGV